MKLLNIDANAKTIKGQKRGFMTAVLYLAPWKMAGINVCPMAELAGCIAGCLNTAGRGGISKGSVTMATPAGDVPANDIQRCRIKRTQLYANDRATFMAQLVKEITAFEKRATRKGLTPVVRLNGTSDIRWENVDAGDGFTIFATFPHLTFYDYTKIPNRHLGGIANYHLSLSFSAASPRYSQICFDAIKEEPALNLVVVFRGHIPSQWYGRDVVDGDASDLRFLDPTGVIVGLKAKGKARKDQSGFVVDA